MLTILSQRVSAHLSALLSIALLVLLSAEVYSAISVMLVSVLATLHAALSVVYWLQVVG